MTPEQPEPNAHRPTEECDLVMKGGITSGVIYPTTARRLAQRYRFRNVGGASVGAIAAAVTAAAEYGRQTGRGAGFAQLDLVNQEIAREGFLISLFKPRPAVRGLFAVYLAAIRKQGPLSTFATVLRQALWVTLLLVAWWGTLGVTAWWLGARWWLIPALLVVWGLLGWAVLSALTRRVRGSGFFVGILLPIAWPLLLAIPSIGMRSWRGLSQHDFGFIPGSSAEGDALCDWLHHHVQAAAGLDEGQPLTFGMLRKDRGLDGEPVGIDLQMMTTDVSTARPVRLPRDLEGYAFDPGDLRDVLPGPVTKWLEDQGTPEGGVVRLPVPDDLPVLLGFRMSLSFPLLFTAVRLYAPAPETLDPRPVAHWFSDGGIGSNFPIHFFDAWVPKRPTFALSFAPFPLDREGRLLVEESDVGLPPAPNGARLPRWVGIDGIGGFISQMLDTMQNWRDTVQSELPGFRDRVYEARLDKEAGEGGLNLGMDAATIERLQARGGRVGQAIIDTFDFDQHFFTRYLLAMQQLELGLVGQEVVGTTRETGLRDVFAARRERFAAGDVGAGELFGRTSDWLPRAGTATWALIQAAETWAEFGRYMGDQPRPQPVMRVIPDV
ncbi:MAG: hypothetical protein ACRDIX_10190 [Actinomycetota bacterium]